MSLHITTSTSRWVEAIEYFSTGNPSQNHRRIYSCTDFIPGNRACDVLPDACSTLLTCFTSRPSRHMLQDGGLLLSAWASQMSLASLIDFHLGNTLDIMLFGDREQMIVELIIWKICTMNLYILVSNLYNLYNMLYNLFRLVSMSVKANIFKKVCCEICVDLQ